MPGFLVVIPKPVFKSLPRIPLPWRERIVRAINFLEIQPFYGKKMSGNQKSKRRLRVWPYRIVYKINNTERIITILEIAHRGNVSYD